MGFANAFVLDFAFCSMHTHHVQNNMQRVNCAALLEDLRHVRTNVSVAARN